MIYSITITNDNMKAFNFFFQNFKSLNRLITGQLSAIKHNFPHTPVSFLNILNLLNEHIPFAWLLSITKRNLVGGVKLL